LISCDLNVVPDGTLTENLNTNVVLVVMGLNLTVRTRETVVPSCPYAGTGLRVYGLSAWTLETGPIDNRAERVTKTTRRMGGVTFGDRMKYFSRC